MIGWSAGLIVAAALTSSPTSTSASPSVEVRAVLAAYHDAVAAEPRLRHARALVAEGSPSALPTLRDYTRDHPENGYGWYLLGVAHTALNEEAAAAGAFARAAAVKPALRILLEEAKRRKAGARR